MKCADRDLKLNNKINHVFHVHTCFCAVFICRPVRFENRNFIFFSTDKSKSGSRSFTQPDDEQTAESITSSKPCMSS